MGAAIGKRLIGLYTSESGATMVEYALLVGLLAVATAAAITQLRTTTGNVITKEKHYLETHK